MRRLGVADMEPLVSENRRVHSCGVEGSETMKRTRAPSAPKDNLSALVDHLVFKEHPAEEDHPTCAEKAVTISQSTLVDAIVGKAGFSKEAVTALLTCKERYSISRTERPSEGMLQIWSIR